MAEIHSFRHLTITLAGRFGSSILISVSLLRLKLLAFAGIASNTSISLISSCAFRYSFSLLE
ncbi:hypothetical protein AHAS_Ahas10G0114900 [Arachis hypogaea]